jgi:putative hydrolase of the HAD superfamily
VGFRRRDDGKPVSVFRRFEGQRGLPKDFLRGINARNHDHNAWARFERSELSPQQFDEAFATETRAAGHEVRGLDVIDLLYGEIRPQMVTALKLCKGRFINACVTNNVSAGPGRGIERDSGRARESKAILELFDIVIESSKVGVRKPEVRFFELACAQLGITAPQAVYLDDLGTNLKPGARNGDAHHQGGGARDRDCRTRERSRNPPDLTALGSGWPTGFVRRMREEHVIHRARHPAQRPSNQRHLPGQHEKPFARGDRPDNF